MADVIIIARTVRKIPTPSLKALKRSFLPVRRARSFRRVSRRKVEEQKRGREEAAASVEGNVLSLDNLIKDFEAELV